MKHKSRRRPFSLEIRLTVLISLAAIITFSAFAGIILNSVQRHFNEQDRQRLAPISNALIRVLEDPQKSARQKQDDMDLILSSQLPVAVVLLGKNGTVLYRSTDLPFLESLHNTDHTATPSEHTFSWQDPHQAHAETWRVLSSSVTLSDMGNDGQGTLRVALSTAFHLHYLDTLKVHLFMIAVLMSLVIILTVCFAVHKGYQPLRQVSDNIRDITSDNFDIRLDPLQVPIELEQLIISFNSMMTRMEDVFIRQANFSADIAHEIRTPITNLVTQTEIALSHSRTGPELEEILYSSLEEYHRLAKMVSGMLFLARADNNQLFLEHTSLDLDNEIYRVFEFFEALAEERKVSLIQRGTAGPVDADAVMVRQMISNLLSNALRYTPRGEAVTVRVCDRDQWTEIVVENPGKPIECHDLSRLFDRFYRADPARQRQGEGSGIGLSIVKSIVAVHNGQVYAESDIHSTRFTVLLPRSGWDTE